MGGTLRAFAAQIAGEVSRFGHGGRRLSRRPQGKLGLIAGTVAAASSLAVVAGMLGTIPVAAADPTVVAPFDVSLVSVLPDSSGAFASTDAGVTASDDGRYVAFVGTGGGFAEQLFVRDRQADTTSLISKDGGGAAASAPIDGAAMSGAGNAVAFLTAASLLPSVPDDGSEHAYVAAWPSGTITTVPLPAAPSATVAVVDSGIAISGDGSQVAFVGGNIDDSAESLVVADMTSGTATDVASAGFYEFPQLSADGSVVAAMGSGCCGNSLYVYTTTGEQLDNFGDVSDPIQSSGGSGSTDSPSPSSTGGSGGPADIAVAPYSLSADGKFVAFDTYVADALRPAIFGVYQDSEVPVSAGRYDGDPRLSADGRAVGYVDESNGSQVVVGNPPDSAAGQLPVTTSDGSQPDGTSAIGQLTENGKAVVFSSSATNLGSSDGSQQVYYATSADAAAPTWAADAALAVDSTSYFTADLSWLDADDDVGVTAYRIFVDGKQFAAVDGYDTTFTVTGLAPGSPHTFGVSPVDFLGHQGTELTATATTTAVARTQVIDSVSVLPDGRPAATSGTNPSVSANGRYVAFIGSSNCYANPFRDNAILLSQETLSCYQDNQALVRDRQAGTTTLLSHVVGEPGVPPQGPYDYTSDVAMSGDGSEVAFVSEGDELVADDTNQTADLFVADRASALVHGVTIPDLGVPITHVAEGAGISLDADGTHVAFLGEENDDTGHLIVEDWRARTATLIPVPAGTYQIDEPELSSDGSKLAFVAFLPDAQTQVIVVNVADPTTPVLSRVIGDQNYYAYDSGTLEPRISLSGEGRYLAYPMMDAQRISHLEVQDLSAPATAPTVITNPVQPTCNPTATACYDMGAPALSADGSTLVFDPMTVTGNHTLYKASPANGTATPVAALPDGTTDDSYPGDRTPAITADGTGVVFQSNDDALAQLTSGDDVVYEHDPNAVAPSFGGGAAITADNLTGSQVRLRWPATTDDHAVIGYRLTQDGVTIADLDSTVTNFTVKGLTAGSTYHFAVSGVDAALNVGTPLRIDVTTPGGTQPPGQAPLAVDDSAGGGHATLTWDPSSDPTVTGYRVLRGTGDTGALSPIADVDGGSASSFTDSGLAASTTYRYEVHTLEATGEQNYTVTTSVTTPALSAATVSLNASFVDGVRAAKLGSDLTVTVHGGANLTATATITYTNADSTAGSAELNLAETAPNSGIYTGKFTLAEGIASVDAVTAALADGAGHSTSASATGLPLPVGGALTITINSPVAGTVDGAKLAVLSAGSDTGAQQTVNSGQTVTLPLAAASDYTLTLTEPDSYAAAPNYPVLKQDGIVVGAGTTSALTLQPVLPAFVSVTVTPTSEAQVDVYDASGALIGTKSSADAAAQNAFGPVPAGSKVTIDSTVLNESQQTVKHESQTVTLVPGDNSVTVSHTQLPTATISGTLSDNGAPVHYGHITAVETVDGRPWTFTTNTRNDGTYAFTVLAGDATLSATAADALPGAKNLTVAAGATGDGDLDLEGPHHYQITLGLTTIEPDGSTATLPVDWRTGVHFGVRVNGPRYDSGWGGISPTITVDGLPGDVYTMCANGAQAGLPASCNSVTLGDTDLVSLNVTLAGAGRLTGTLLANNGQPFAGHWTAYLYELVNGQRRSIDTALGTGSALSVDLPEAGSYEVDVAGAGGLNSEPITATVAQGGVVSLGNIPLGLDRNFTGSGNYVVGLSSEITPGQVAEFRAAYTYGGGGSVAATIRLGIPAGTTLVPGSVTLNGQAVADPGIVNGFAEVTLPSLTSGAAGTVHYAVQTTSATPAGPLSAIVRMRYGSTGDALIGSATTTVVGVTLAAPTEIKGLTATVTGHAPAGATVAVYDEFGQPVGTALATAGGLWSASITLANRGEGHSYSLQAATTVGSVSVRSDTQWVTHNSHSVQPTTLSVGQADGRVVSFDPNSGVARFPYVFVPGMGLNVSACFPSGTQVSNMSARIGPSVGGASGQGVFYGSASPGFVDDAAPRSNASLITAMQSPRSADSAALVGGSGSGTGNCYSAYLNPSTTQLGAIYLDYTASPAPFNASDLQMSPGEARESLPPGLSDYSGSQVTDNGDGNTTFTASLPGVGGSVSATTSTSSVTYTPTAQDLADSAASGVPVYGLSTDVSTSTDPATSIDTITASVSFYVPSSWLSATTGQSGQARAGFATAAALLSPDAVLTTAKVVMKGKSLIGALRSGGPYQQLSALLDEIDSGCADPAQAKILSDYLSNVADDIAQEQAVKAGMMLLGAVGGFALLGPFGSFAVSTALSFAADHAIAHTLQSAKDFVHSQLGSDTCQPQSDEIADPDWVIDPSGFTYEAVTSNRLPGVTATLLQSTSPDGPFKVWDAAAYGQENPLTTDNDGKYGWNVPFGYWKVAYSKPGYETAYSQVFRIPPPRFDVNVGLVRLAGPTVTLTRATSGAASSVTVTFDDYLKVSSVNSRITVVDGNGNPISGSVQPVDAQTAPDGASLATTFRFAPDQPFTDGEALTVDVDALVRDYADHTLNAAFSAGLTASAPTTPGIANDVRAFAVDAHSVVVKWTAPADDGGSPITSYQVTAGDHSIDVAADATSATIGGLDPVTSYTVSVAAVNAVGPGAQQSVIVATPPLSPDAAFGSFQAPTSIEGGTSGQSTIALPDAAAADTTVTLSSDSSVASVPHDVTVAAGQTSTTFDIATVNPVVDTDVTVTASRGGASENAPVTVRHVDVALQATTSATGVALSWPGASDTDVTGYRVMRAVGDGSFSALADVDASTSSYTDTTAAPGTAYHYQVFALLQGNALPWSRTADVNTPLRSVTLNLTSSPSAPVEGTDVTVNVVATPADAGTAVQVSEGTTALGSGVVGADGSVAIVLSGLAAGAHQLTVAYAGGATTAPATGSMTVTVASVQHAPVATKLTVEPLRSLWDLIALALGRYRVTAHLVRADSGAPIAGQRVLIDSWAGTFCTATTDASGTASCPVPPRLAGIVLTGQVHASYAGSPDYLPSQFGSNSPPRWGRGR